MTTMMTTMIYFEDILRGEGMNMAPIGSLQASVCQYGGEGSKQRIQNPLDAPQYSWNAFVTNIEIRQCFFLKARVRPFNFLSSKFLSSGALPFHVRGVRKISQVH